MKRLITVVSITLAVAGPTLADTQPGSQTVAINLGGAIPLTKLDLTGVGGGTAKVGTSGIFAGGQYLYQILGHLGVGADVNYSNFGDNTSSTLIPAGDSTISSKALVALAIAKFNFLTEGKVLPYLLAGIGIHNTNLKIDTKPSPGFFWLDTGTTETRNVLDDSATNFAFGVGTGLDIPMTQNLIFGVELRYQYLASSTYATTPMTQQATGITDVKGAASMINIFGRLGYKF